LRTGEVSRRTRETDVYVKVNLDGSGASDVVTGVGFLDHMLVSLATHSLIDITAKASGDLTHHTVEDVAICLGEDCSYGLFLGFCRLRPCSQTLC